MSASGGRLADIPANVVIGRRGPQKAAFIESLLSLRPPGETWALLRNDGEKEPAASSDPTGIRISQVADGCICCSAQVELRIALTRLLREARPRRLIIEPSSQANLKDVLRLLADRWLAPVLSVRSTLGVIEAAEAASPAEPWLSCDVVAVTNLATAAAVESLQTRWKIASPDLRVVPANQLTLMDLDLEPLHPVRPLFRSGNA